MNKKFVYQVGNNNKKVILWCTANQISRRQTLFTGTWHQKDRNIKRN